MEEKMNTEISFVKDGPIIVNGDIKIVQPDGLVIESKKSFLCRCGASGKKPYCDGSHRKVEFKD